MGLQDPAAVEEDMDGATNTISTIFYPKLFHSLTLNLFSMSVSLHIKHLYGIYWKYISRQYIDVERRPKFRDAHAISSTNVHI